MFFRPGSVIAEFQLTFKTKVTGEEALAPLKRETAGGKLGSLEVAPTSLTKPKSPKQGVVLRNFSINTTCLDIRSLHAILYDS